MSLRDLARYVSYMLEPKNVSRAITSYENPPLPRDLIDEIMYGLDYIEKNTGLYLAMTLRRLLLTIV